MPKKELAGKKKPAKKLPAAPIGGPAKAVKKSSTFEKRTRNFRIGGDIQPKRNLTRFVKWPQYIRLQRQKRILLQRLKVPPSIAQFSHTMDREGFMQLTRLCKKIAPESKEEKKQRLEAKAAGTAAENKVAPVIKFGINHVTELVESKKAKLVIIAHDVDPVELICWLPALCRKKDIPYCVIKSKSRLGQLVGQKSCTAAAITNVPKEDVKELEVLIAKAKESFNDNKEIQRKWGGGIMGVKSNHVTRRREMLIAREMEKKAGLRA